MRHFSPSGPPASQIRRPAFFLFFLFSLRATGRFLHQPGVHCCAGRCLERSLRPRACSLRPLGRGHPHEAAAGHTARPWSRALMTRRTTRWTSRQSPFDLSVHQETMFPSLRLFCSLSLRLGRNVEPARLRWHDRRLISKCTVTQN